MSEAQPSKVFSFGPFKLDLRAGELYKDQGKIRLQEQPLQVLSMLVDHACEVVTREEIRKKLWPNDTVVEFNDSINAAVKKLRLALGDSAEEPHYVETVARRGYRLMVPVEWAEAQPPEAREVEGEAADEVHASAKPNLAGSKVSHYRVLEILGGGGMGVVYKAEDLKLGRRVALKFLPEELTSDPIARGRFEREARSASTLNHPNICTIYEVGDHLGQPFIAMELLEGQTLRDRLATAARPQFTTAELLDFAGQIAHGLEAAHEKGIIHRDIKPANIFITHRREVKILDFGLAKLVAADVVAEPETIGGVPLPDSPTASSLTRTGATMGTASYMSPEQVRGKKLDARTDLFSFGLVLYEMASGRRAFPGETAEMVHAAILRETPTPVLEWNSELPPKLDAIINKALQKGREQRYQSASEMGAGLRSLQLQADTGTSLRRRWLAPVLASVLASGALVMWVWARLGTVRPRELIQRQLTTNSTDNLVESAILSPDGKYLLFGDQIGVHARLIATGETHTFGRPAGFEDLLWYPNAWFPDGAHFIAVSQKPTPQGQRVTSWLVSVLGSATTLLRDDSEGQAVSPDGLLIAFTSGGPGTDRDICIMGPRGEDARRILAGGDFNTFRMIQWSPQGRRLAYSRAHASGEANWEYSIESCDLNGEAVTVIVRGLTGEAGLCWLPDGRIIYSVDERAANDENTNLWEIRADPTTGQARGPAHRITNWLGIHTDRFSFSADGKRMVVQKSWGLLHAFIGRLQADGRLETPRRLTMEDSHDVPLAWTADSKAVLFLSDRTGVWKLYKQALDQAQAEPLTTGPDENRFARLSPDGRWVLYSSLARNGAQFARYLRVPLSGGAPEFIMQTQPAAVIECPVSPAMECILTEWSRDRKETILTSFDPLTGSRHKLFKMEISAGRGACCIVSPDGSEFAVLLNDPEESRVRLLSHDGKIERDIPVRGWTNLNSVDWAADGQSLFVSSGRPPGSTLLRVDRSGRVEPLWTCTNGVTRAIQSRDGRYLALLGYNSYSNAWLVENF